MYVHVGLCRGEKTTSGVYLALHLGCCYVYHHGVQASGDPLVSASHLLHRSAVITDVCFCTQLLHGSGHLKSGPHECMARTFYPLSHLQMSKTIFNHIILTN